MEKGGRWMVDVDYKHWTSSWRIDVRKDIRTRELSFNYPACSRILVQCHWATCRSPTTDHCPKATIAFVAWDCDSSPYHFACQLKRILAVCRVSNATWTCVESASVAERQAIYRLRCDSASWQLCCRALSFRAAILHSIRNWRNFGYPFSVGNLQMIFDNKEKRDSMMISRIYCEILRWESTHTHNFRQIWKTLCFFLYVENISRVFHLSRLFCVKIYKEFDCLPEWEWGKKFMNILSVAEKFVLCRHKKHYFRSLLYFCSRERERGYLIETCLFTLVSVGRRNFHRFISLSLSLCLCPISHKIQIFQSNAVVPQEKLLLFDFCNSFFLSRFLCKDFFCIKNILCVVISDNANWSLPRERGRTSFASGKINIASVDWDRRVFSALEDN